MSFLTLFIAAAVPNHTAGSTPLWLNVLGILFIAVVLVIVVLRQKRK